MPRRSPSIRRTVFAITLGVVSVFLLASSLVSMAVFSSIVSESVLAQAREINKQIVMNFESYASNIIETANTIQYASASLDVDRDASALSELYRVDTETKKDVIAVYLFDQEGRLVAGEGINPGLYPQPKARQWFISAMQRGDIYNFSSRGESSIARGREEEVIDLSRKVSFTRDHNAESGVLLVELNYDVITDLARRTNLGQFGHLLILSDKGDLLYSSEAGPERMTALSAPIAAGMYLGEKRVSLAGTDMFINVTTLTPTRWLIATVSNINALKVAMYRLGALLIAIFLLSIGVSALVAALHSLSVSRPINQLISAMQLVESGDFSTPVVATGPEEIIALSDSFNTMVRKVQELMLTLVGQQRDKRKLELQMLQNQINPHFLYNTLDSIVWLAERERNADVIQTVVSLARFFRISISKGESFIPVADEISHVSNYLTIQRIRYGDRFVYSIRIDEALKDLKIMKLVLQPLVENAIYHGIGEEGGEIGIEGRLEGEAMYFSVRNNGYGITETRIQEMYQSMRGEAGHKSVGIRNVYQRLKLYYGEAADISISSILDESTTVTLKIPRQVPEEAS